MSDDLLCVACKKPIPDGAIICTECDSYQDWRRHLSYSTTTLSLLVALIAVAGSTAPVIWGIVHSPTSHLHVELATVGPLAYRPCTPCPERLMPLAILVSNAGDAGGVIVLEKIELAGFISESDDGNGIMYFRFYYSSPSPHDPELRASSVDAGETQLIKAIYWAVPAVETIPPGTIDLTSLPSTKNTLQVNEGTVTVKVYESDGTERTKKLPLPAFTEQLVRIDDDP